jgi:putative ABC transport system ATP-binding protein
MILIQDLHKYYKNETLVYHALKNINIKINQGEFISIEGMSGSGKSTLLNIIGLLDNYDSGNYFLDGVPTNIHNESEIAILRKKYIGFIFQSFNLLPYKSALENVALPLMYHGISREKRIRLAAKYLKSLGLERYMLHLPEQLSGGQQQRVAIARALITQPKVILADEPTGSLDSFNTLEIMSILKNISVENNITVIIVTHEEMVTRMTDRKISLTDGFISK